MFIPLLVRYKCQFRRPQVNPSDYSMSGCIPVLCLKIMSKPIQSAFLMFENSIEWPGPTRLGHQGLREHLGARSVSCWKATRCCCVCRNCLQRSSRWASQWCGAAGWKKCPELIGGLHMFVEWFMGVQQFNHPRLSSKHSLLEIEFGRLYAFCHGRIGLNDIKWGHGGIWAGKQWSWKRQESLLSPPPKKQI